MARYDLIQGDLSPALQLTLTGAGALLSGSTVTFLMAQADGPTTVSGAAVVDNPGGAGVDPVVHYAWRSGDTDVPGVYRAQVRVTANGLPETYPSDEDLFVIIRPSVG